jgi:hypothetical protein
VRPLALSICSRPPYPSPQGQVGGLWLCLSTQHVWAFSHHLPKATLPGKAIVPALPDHLLPVICFQRERRKTTEGSAPFHNCGLL